MASAARLRIRAMSSGVAISSRSARSPMTYTRSAACGSCAQKSMSCSIRSVARRKSGNVSQAQSSPSCSAMPGMSSTPSISSIRLPRSAARTGANPTPQLPITTVVTPCQLDGARREFQMICPS
ncbi:Uncharacterised protein [Bordetella pertussis]|nr:Uncharacterised protein [Bordetella pertussis]CPP70540.1 Uncharacterised protein [Bordetella pertussis]